MDVSQFDFHLPEELIAQSPLPHRSASRLMVFAQRDREIGAPELFRSDGISAAEGCSWLSTILGFALPG